MRDTIPPLIKLSGTTANKTNVVTSVIAGLTFVPISTILAPEPSGSNGFGYDPYFISELGVMAELTAEEKDSISHRGKALRLFKEELKKYI